MGTGVEKLGRVLGYLWEVLGKSDLTVGNCDDVFLIYMEIVKMVSSCDRLFLFMSFITAPPAGNYTILPHQSK